MSARLDQDQDQGTRPTTRFPSSPNLHPPTSTTPAPAVSILSWALALGSLVLYSFTAFLGRISGQLALPYHSLQDWTCGMRLRQATAGVGVGAGAAIGTLDCATTFASCTKCQFCVGTVQCSDFETRLTHADSLASGGNGSGPSFLLKPRARQLGNRGVKDGMKALVKSRIIVTACPELTSFVLNSRDFSAGSLEECSPGAGGRAGSYLGLRLGALLSTGCDLSQDEWQFCKSIIRAFLNETQLSWLRTFDAQASCAINSSSTETQMHEYAVNSIHECIFGPHIPFTPYAFSIFNQDDLDASIKNALHERLMKRHGCESFNGNSSCFLAFLASLTSDVALIKKTLNVFLETWTTLMPASLTTVMHHITSHPSLASRLGKEIRINLGASSSPISRRDLSGLRYLTTVISECLRVSPIMPVIVRKASRRVTWRLDMPGEPPVCIDKGTTVCCAVGELCKDPGIWGPTVHEFNPDRFVGSEPFDDRYPPHFYPLGAGHLTPVIGKLIYDQISVYVVRLLRNGIREMGGSGDV
ncbi:hypothetical protein AX17_006826 [Amanita inopinata Kibby_2008]|nr:hypothetical protein AX17_006826 [Amanita inopinata Kibby_2008]